MQGLKDARAVELRELARGRAFAEAGSPTLILAPPAGPPLPVELTTDWAGAGTAGPAPLSAGPGPGLGPEEARRRSLAAHALSMDLLAFSERVL